MLSRNVHYWNVYYLCGHSVKIQTSCICVFVLRWYIGCIRINACCTFCSKTDHNVGVALVQLLEGQRGDVRPNVQCSADGSVYIRLLQIWCIIHYPETSGDRGQGKWLKKWYWCNSSPPFTLYSFQCIPECDIVILPFEVSGEVVVFPNVWDATSGQLHHLQSVVIQIPWYLQRGRNKT